MTTSSVLRRLREVTLQEVGFVSASFLVGGAATTVIYGLVGASCPFRAVGLACPGCGCGRAATILATEGPVSSLRAQPTAFLLLGVLVTLSLLGMRAGLLGRRTSGYVHLRFLGAAALANLSLQLVRSVSA